MRKLWNAKKILIFASLRIQWVCQIRLQKKMKMYKEKNENESQIPNKSDKCGNLISKIYTYILYLVYEKIMLTKLLWLSI